MLYVTQGKGFQLSFENGWTVSVQWGELNYCENRKLGAILKGSEPPQPNPDAYQSRNAEIAAWDKDFNWYDFGDGQVKGWVTADEVADFIYLVKNF